MSQVTSHILDTSTGKPAAGIMVILFQQDSEVWIEVSRKLTNIDGRVTDLVPQGLYLQAGIHKIKFLTKKYFDFMGLQTFYPFIEIVFDLTGNENYHLPLLLSPFGYSTYRGS
jgi:5-hydroxyisourate hydrolase